MKKLVVDDSCIGCGACVAIDENHFEFSDDGVSHAISNENLDSAEVKDAIETCPVGAIKIVDTNANDECKCEKDNNCACENCECHNEE